MWPATALSNSPSPATWSSPPTSRWPRKSSRKAGHALNPRGELYTQDNIQERLTLRNFLGGLRNAGVMTGGPSVMSHSDRQIFANQLDRFLTRRQVHKH